VCSVIKREMNYTSVCVCVCVRERENRKMEKENWKSERKQIITLQPKIYPKGYELLSTPISIDPSFI
jgi:hypothetical protein